MRALKKPFASCKEYASSLALLLSLQLPTPGFYCASSLPLVGVQSLQRQLFHANISGRRYFRFFKFIDCFHFASTAFHQIGHGEKVTHLLEFGKWSCLGMFLSLEATTIVSPSNPASRSLSLLLTTVCSPLFTVRCHRCLAVILG
jgi:hypothetical protein